MSTKMIGKDKYEMSQLTVWCKKVIQGCQIVSMTLVAGQIKSLLVFVLNTFSISKDNHYDNVILDDL